MSTPAAQQLARHLKDHDLTFAVAESLTCGALASAIGAVGEASEWFKGGVTAYMNDVKFRVLGVSPGPVVTDACARQMAAGVRSLFGADIAVAVTGVGGPGPEEGKPAGTVFIGVDSADGTQSREYHFPGDPEQVLEATIQAALALTLECLTQQEGSQGGGRA